VVDARTFAEAELLVGVSCLGKVAVGELVVSTESSSQSRETLANKGKYTYLPDT
jgi:hypothetical protein